MKTLTGGVGVCAVGVVGVDDVGGADGDEAADDEDDSQPPEPLQPPAEEHGGQDASEDDHRPSQHLKNLFVKKP